MLPKINLPTYKIKLPSNGKEIQIRPFVVKEEKLLLMAIESGDDREIIDTTKQVINNCIIDSDININKLPFFDIDYLFIALRAKSIGEAIDIKFTCNAMKPNGEVCKNVFPASIDVSNCSIVKDDTVSKDISLGNGIVIKMKYPDYTTMKSIMDNDNVFDKKINIIAGSIEHIINGDNITSMKDITKEELFEFIENLTQEHFNKLEYFVNNFPSFVVNTDAVCDSCGFQHHLQYKEFASFFV